MKKLTIILLTASLLHINMHAGDQVRRAMRSCNNLSEKTRGEIRCCVGCIVCCCIAPRLPVLCGLPLCSFSCICACFGLEEYFIAESRERIAKLPTVEIMEAKK